ncbi:hypothetical protein [Pirellula sp. SH-Sr6A]|uniref:hypothetical protein n=1 Tax=Pirellula sp. SH-Sr6A TaxID=1632865 RepID=UPI0011BAB78F|nr:hypothetical protein [Pirellula sp. SH-Sr6A]
MSKKSGQTPQSKGAMYTMADLSWYRFMTRNLPSGVSAVHSLMFGFPLTHANGLIFTPDILAPAFRIRTGTTPWLRKLT